MPRSIRIEHPGALGHVMARGNRREPIYRNDDDRRFFLATMSEACAPTGRRVHAWVLMRNHYHLLIQTPEPNLVDGMKKRRQRKPANPPQAAGGQETAKRTPNMDQFVKSCRLTPIFQ